MKNNNRNNFDILRLFFAVMVVYSHSFALLGIEQHYYFNRTLGNISVHGFFIVSGYLIADSYIRYPRLFAFSWNRVLRIVPALVVAIAASRYAWEICDQYKGNPVPFISNGPVWTLSWEVFCYIGVALLGLLSLLNRSAGPILFAVLWIVYLANSGNSTNFYAVIAPLLVTFSSGVFIRLAGENINLKKMFIPSMVVLFLVSVDTVSTPVLEALRSNITLVWGADFTNAEFVSVAYLAMFPFAVMYIGKELPVLFNVRDDISYGVYVYGWPVAQVLVFLGLTKGMTLTPLSLFFVTMLITIPIAWLSWRLIERPSMQFKMRKAPALITPVAEIKTPDGADGY